MASAMEGDPRRTEMKAPDEVAAMIRLKELGGNEADCRGIGLFPEYREALAVVRELAAVCRDVAVEATRRVVGLACGAISPAQRQCRRDPPGVVG